MSQQAEAPLVTGRLVIAGATPPFHGGTAHVRLEDVTYADAPAVVIVETTIGDVNHDPTTTGNDTVIPFALLPRQTAPPVVEKNDYAVRAWIDLDSDGGPSHGDLFSQQAHRVLTRGFGNTVMIAFSPPANR